MTIYTFSEARQKFSALLDKAKSEGKVLVKRKDGTVFMIQPVAKAGSPLNVESVDLGLSAEEIVGVIRETRER